MRGSWESPKAPDLHLIPRSSKSGVPCRLHGAGDVAAGLGHPGGDSHSAAGHRGGGTGGGRLFWCRPQVGAPKVISKYLFSRLIPLGWGPRGRDPCSCRVPLCRRPPNSAPATERSQLWAGPPPLGLRMPSRPAVRAAAILCTSPQGPCLRLPLPSCNPFPDTCWGRC